MPEVQYNPQAAVWTYTYAEGPESGQVFFHSPQRSWSDQRASLVLRQVNSTDENKVWINTDPSLVVRCDELNSFPTPVDAHGVILCSGQAKSLSPSRESVIHRRGERIWVEHDMKPGTGAGVMFGHSDLIPVISLDTLEHFEISYRNICFVPQISRLNADDRLYYGAPLGPVRNCQLSLPRQLLLERHDQTQQQQPRRTQAWIEWPIRQPQLALFQWQGRPSDHGFQPIESVEERRRLFQQDWVVSSQKNKNTGVHLKPIVNNRAETGHKDRKDAQADSEPGPAGPVNVSARLRGHI